MRANGREKIEGPLPKDISNFESLIGWSHLFCHTRILSDVIKASNPDVLVEHRRPFSSSSGSGTNFPENGLSNLVKIDNF
jgi:hypothetical protein